MRSMTPATDILLGRMARSIFLAGFQAANPSVSNVQAAEDAWNDYIPPEEDVAEIQRLDRLLVQHEETSAEVASLAGRVLNMKERTPQRVLGVDYNALLRDAKSLAGSALTQREPDHES